MTINYLSNKSRPGVIDYIKSSCNAMNDGIENINATNNTMFDIVDKSLTYASSLTDSLKLLANQMQDIIVCNGYTAKRPNLFAGIEAETLNTVVDKESLSIRLRNKQVKRENIKSVNITVNGKNIDFNEGDLLLDNGKGVSIESVDLRAYIAVDIILKNEAIISEIDLTLSDLGLKLPKITRIIATTSSNLITNPLILNSNDFSYQLSLTDSIVRIKPVVVKKIRLLMTQDDSELSSQKNIFKCLIKKLSIGSAQAYNSGQVIFGPIKSDSAILKSAIAFSSTDYVNVKTSISNNKEDWIYVHNTNDITPDTKIANYNNVDISSKLLAEEVKSIYVRFELAATNLMPDNFIDKYIVRLVNATDGYVDVGYEEEYKVNSVYKSLPYAYGRQKSGLFKLSDISIPYGIIGPNKLSLIGDESIFVEKQRNVFFDMDGLVAHDGIVKTKNSYPGVDIKLYSVSKPTGIYMTSDSVEDVCLKVGVRNDIYRLVYKEQEWKLDLRNGFITSMEVLNFEANQGDTVDVYDSLGSKIATVAAVLVGGKYIISLHDTLMTTIIFAGFNKYYPYNQSVGTYGVSKGKIDSGGTKLTNIFAYAIYKNQVMTNIESNAINKEIKPSTVIISRYSQSLNDFRFTKSAKLKHCNIIQGSVTVDTSQCPVPSMETEVKFIDGVREFQQLEVISIEVNGAVNTIDIPRTIPNTSQITINGETDLFVNRVYQYDDLNFSGDYFIDNNTKEIKLPDGIFTTDYLRTEITFEGVGETGIDRLFSVDYENGIIYTFSPISENTTVTYSHSMMYASYSAVEELDDIEYTDTGNSIIINSDAQSYLVELLPKDTLINGISTSPIVKNIDIKYTV